MPSKLAPLTRRLLTTEDATEFLRQAFDAEVTSVEPLGKGQNVQALSFALHDCRYVAKFSFTKRGLYKDKFAYDHFHSERRPIPKTIAILDLPQDDAICSITELAPGSKLSLTSGSELSDALRSSMVDLIVLNRSATLHGQNFGVWNSRGLARFPNWIAYLSSLIDTVNGDVSAFLSFFSQQEIDTLLSNYRTLMARCPNDRNLIHGDFSRENIFSDKDSITAIVDWDNSMYGDAIYDLAWISFWEPELELEAVYRSKIERLGISEPNVEERLACYKMHCAVSSLRWYVHSHQTDSVQFNRAREFLKQAAGRKAEPKVTGHYYHDIDQPHFDYDPHPVRGLGTELFRGPAVDLDRPYIACIGAAQTFGRFCDRPFATQLADALQRQVLNLGTGGAGPGLFDRDEYLEILNRSQMVVVQVLSARSEGNSLFDNTRTGSLMGIRKSDGKAMRFEHFLEELMKTDSVATVERAVQETRSNYVERMVRLLDRIRVPKLLLWLSTRSPDRGDDYSGGPYALLGPFPQLVNRSMVEALRPHSDAYVECTSHEGIPQRLWPGNSPIDGTEVENGVLVNRYYPSPEMHDAAARKLIPQCLALLEGRQQPVSAGPAGATDQAACGQFLVVCAERTGSNLLLGLLKSHDEVLAGGELFNPVLMERGNVAWSLAQQDEVAALSALRGSDPVAFLRHLFAMAARDGRRMAGFKLMYGHADQQQQVRDYLVANPELRVIHLKRRNLLRRFLSEERARVTGEWAAGKGAAAKQLPTLALDFKDCLENFAYIESRQAKYDALFREHRVLELFYEDLSDDPQTVGSSVLSFLGVEQRPHLTVDFAKTGVDPLRTAIANYDELKGKFRAWADFFTD